MCIQYFTRLQAVSAITYRINECSKSSWRDQSASWWESASRANYQKDECSSVADSKVAKWQLMITKQMPLSNKTRRWNWKNKTKQSNNKSRPSIFLSSVWMTKVHQPDVIRSNNRWTRSIPTHNIRVTIFVFTHKIRSTTNVPQYIFLLNK